MDKEKVLNIARQLEGNTRMINFYAQQAELLNLIQAYAGKSNSFYDATEKIKITAILSDDYLESMIASFIRSVEQDVISKVSFERKIKIEIVNDYLVQAEEIGASLEEFLRTWVSEQNLDYSQKASMDSYAKALRSKDLITKQDYKEITAWGGDRNNAAHGKWDLVADREKISMMLAGVNIFIKQYSN